MGSSLSKGSSPQASVIPISSSIGKAPVAISTVPIITTIIQSGSGRIVTLHQTETLKETIIISVTTTAQPTNAPVGVAPAVAQTIIITTTAPARAYGPAPAIIIATTAPARGSGPAPVAIQSVAAPQPAEEESTTSSSCKAAATASKSRSVSGAEPVATQSAQRAAATISATRASAAAAQQTPQAELAQEELAQENVKKPIAPPEAIFGGIPDKKVDLPVTIVFLFFFIMGAVTHMARHEINQKKGHKFHLSDLMFDFCMVRTVTTIMRIVWIFKPENNSIVLAALIFQGAGTTVLFAVNAFFTQRIIRAVHPQIGWSPPARILFKLIIASVPAIILYNIINATLSVFLTKPQQAATIHDLVVFGSSYTLFLCSIPITFLLLAAAFPTSSPPEKFGKGGLHSKILIVILASTVLTIGAVIRLYTTVVPKEKENPGAINSKAVFYVTGYMLEIMVVAGYALVRIDLRFWVTDACSGPGMYRAKEIVEEKVEDDNEKLIGEKDVNNDRMSTQSSESFGYTDNTTLSPPLPPPAQAYTVEYQMNPGSPVPEAAGNGPRRPPRSMRWENQPRLSQEDVI